MPITPINVGAGPNDGTGDLLRNAFIKVNANDAALQAEKLAVTGTAVAAQRWATARRINGVLVDGTADASLFINMPSNTDFDTLLTPGDYWVNTSAVAASCPNCPSGAYGALMIQPNAGGFGQGVIQTYTEGGTTPAARRVFQRAKAYSGGTFGPWMRSYSENDPQTQMIGSPSPGTSSTAARTGVLIAEYRGGTGSGATGAIVFTAPDSLAAIMYMFCLLGKEYQTPQVYDEKVNGYRSGSAAAWSSLNRTTNSTKAVPLRLAHSPEGRSCVIFGDVTSTWSYLHLSLFAVLASHNNASTAHLQNWTTALVTDLSGYTNVTADIPATPTIGPVSGNAATATLAASATKLATARRFNGVLFDGTGDVVVPPQSVQIASGDLNTYLADGRYYIASSADAANILNTPENSPGFLEVGRASNLTYLQTYTTYFYNGQRKIYQRTGSTTGPTWSAWDRIYTTIDPQPSVTGNAGSATKLATARNLNGAPFDGTGDVTVPAVSISLTGVGTDLNNVLAPGFYHVSSNASATQIANTPVNIAGALLVQTANSPGVIQTYTTYWNNNARQIFQRAANAAMIWSPWERIYTTIDPPTTITGNAGTATLAAAATKLNTARAINGSNFDGTGAVTTALWGTARNFTLGASTKSVNGGANVAFTLAEMGAVNKAGDTMTGNLNVPSLNGGSLGGLRNKITNGKMDIAQRGVSFPIAGGYTLDRWFFNCGSGAASAQCTVSQQVANFSPSFRNCLQVQVTRADTSIASDDFGQIIHNIEGWDAQDLIGNDFTIGFNVKSSKTGIHCIALRNAAGNKSYVEEFVVNAANTWERKFITVPGGIDPTGEWDWYSGVGLSIRWALASGSSYRGTKGSWQSAAILSTANQVNCLDAVGNTFSITGVQLVRGLIDTEFEHRLFALELALCQRYFERCQIRAVSTPSQAGGYIAASMYFKVEKRSSPSLIAVGTPYSANVNNVNFALVSPSSAHLQAQAVAAGTAEYSGVYDVNSEF